MEIFEATSTIFERGMQVHMYLLQYLLQFFGAFQNKLERALIFGLSIHIHVWKWEGWRGRHQLPLKCAQICPFWILFQLAFLLILALSLSAHDFAITEIRNAPCLVKPPVLFLNYANIHITHIYVVSPYLTLVCHIFWKHWKGFLPAKRILGAQCHSST